MLRPCDDLLLHHLVEQLFQIVVEAVEIGPLLLGDNRFAVLIFCIEHRGQLRTCAGGTLLCGKSGGQNQKNANDDRNSPQIPPFSSARERMKYEAVMAIAAMTTEMTPASR